MRRKSIFALSILVLCAFTATTLYAQTPPPSQTAGGLDKLEREIEKGAKLEEQITKEKPEEEEPVLPSQERKALPEETKILVQQITVTGVTLLPKNIIEKTIAPYRNKELTIAEMQKVCDLITDEYRKKGYVTSRAYLPPQTIQEGLLTIIVIEGKLGDIQVKGNRFFRTSLLKKKLRLKPGNTFNYQNLQKSLRAINEHPDRFVKAVLVPGATPGTTDIVLEVTDRLPIHAGVEVDNFASRFLERYRYSAVVEHNNLLGFDDKLLLKKTISQAGLYAATVMRYTIPATANLEIGAHYLESKMRLGKEYRAADIRGNSQIGGVFFNYGLIKKQNFDLRLNAGFDYKHVRNYILGFETSRDEVRMAKAGFDLDVYDKWGRTILSVEEGVGIPHIFGGVDAKDRWATRLGAGGQFAKFSGSLYRLQPLPFSVVLLWKNQFQMSNSTVPACEQFQIGGITSVRGYPPGEFSGDQGYSTSAEFSFPLYGLPKTIKVPTSKASLYDATRLVLFYDFATVHLNKVYAGEKKEHMLRGWGFGVRMNLPEDFSLRLECAYPIGRLTPSDQNNLHSYVSVSKKF